MKWRIREGFKLFRSPEEAIEFECGNRAVRPRAQAGDEIILDAVELAQLCQQGALGRLEPVDDEALKYFGDTKPHMAHTAVPQPVPERIQ